MLIVVANPLNMLKFLNTFIEFVIAFRQMDEKQQIDIMQKTNLVVTRSAVALEATPRLKKNSACNNSNKSFYHPSYQKYK